MLLAALAVAIVVGVLLAVNFLTRIEAPKKKQKGSGKSADVNSKDTSGGKQGAKDKHQGGKGGKTKNSAAADKPQQKFGNKATSFTHPWLSTNLKGHGSSILDLDCSTNNKLVASCSDDSRTQTENKRPPMNSKRRNKKGKPPPPNISPPTLPPAPPLQLPVSRPQPLTSTPKTPTAPAMAVPLPLPPPNPFCKPTTVKRPVQIVDPTIVVPPVKHEPKIGRTAPRDSSPTSGGDVISTDVAALNLKNKRVPKQVLGVSNSNEENKKNGYGYYSDNKNYFGYSSFGIGNSRLLGGLCGGNRIGDGALYQLLHGYIMDTGQQILHRFPIEVYGMPGLVYVPERSNSLTLYGLGGAVLPLDDDSVRECCRCHLTFNATVLSHSPPGKKRRGGRRGVPAATPPGNKEDRCVYHWGKLQVSGREPGDPTLYTCCYQPEHSPGCTEGVSHVSRGKCEGYLTGFVKTRPTLYKPLDGNYGVCSLDCEMCYTTDGLQVGRVTLLRLDGEVLYETMVKTDSPIVDYNTRFSGLTAENLAGARRTLHDVQRDLLGLLNSQTILIGHGLENDLCALRLQHYTVLDTTALFPHSYGLPYRRSLKSLASLYLHREIQTAEGGHDSYEDAKAAIDLVMWRLRQDVTRKL